jgi:hypothetical protein
VPYRALAHTTGGGSEATNAPAEREKIGGRTVNHWLLELFPCNFARAMPAPAQQQAPAVERRHLPKVGMKEDVFTLDEGEVVLQWPERLSKESFEDLETWMGLQLRKIKRRVVEGG